MAAGASEDEGQGREGGDLDTSHLSNDGARSAVPASLMNVQRIDRASQAGNRDPRAFRSKLLDERVHF
jgi:hypothetical protein